MKRRLWSKRFSFLSFLSKYQKLVPAYQDDISIYTISEPFDTRQNIKKSIEQSPLCFVDENYMEILEFNINTQTYDPQIMSALSK